MFESGRNHRSLCTTKSPPRPIAYELDPEVLGRNRAHRGSSTGFALECRLVPGNWGSRLPFREGEGSAGNLQSRNGKGCLVYRDFLPPFLGAESAGPDYSETPKGSCAHPSLPSVEEPLHAAVKPAEEEEEEEESAVLSPAIPSAMNSSAEVIPGLGSPSVMSETPFCRGRFRPLAASCARPTGGAGRRRLTTESPVVRFVGPGP